NAEGPKEIARLIRIKKPIDNSIGLLKTDRGYAQSPAESLKILMETHFPDCKIGVNFERPSQTNNFGIDYLNYDKVREALNSFGAHKSPGPDGLKPIILQHLGENMTCYITDLYKVILSTGYTPKKWREMK
ncbi:Uncharacterized protein FKW44_021307, partial [Caligus rogercresseyi]